MLKKLLCGLLAALMLTGSLVACNDDDNKESGETKKEGDTNADTSAEALEIPGTKYNDKELCFLTRDEAEWSTVEIFAEQISSSSDNISQAVFERNDRIHEKYGVVIKEDQKSVNDHIADVNREIQSSNGDFQAIITNTRLSSSMASQNLLWDLKSSDVEYLDFSKSWWDKNMAEGMSINDQLFFATGDLLTADNDATFVMLFNKKLATKHQIPDLYKIVDNGEWTFDKMYQFAQQGVEPADGKIAYDNGVAGLAYTGSAPACFMFAGNVTLVQKNDEDVPEYSFNLDHAQNVAEKAELLFSTEHAVQLPQGDLFTTGKTCFGGNHALFFNECMQTVTRMREYDIDFGILPNPKYDTNQKNYASMMHHTASMVSIPVSVVDENLEMTASMIEAMACYSQSTLTVEYYDKNLKTKGAKDELSGPMIDKILANRICDLSYYYQWGNSAYEKIAATLLPDSNKQLASESSRYKKMINDDISKFLSAMDKAS